ncbi:hypothetical protein M422DRAFT_49463 [Sphaerobolus stellatus SS14]|uniref:Uncharacterized protein n=1 Tax=Sphaerobolus stellatus (strain SS14) TaxID=990650 RepID=A0A0C9UYN3_SPHS4|nr:hypothetical protein M422DRAFT_49463 [Sphaerobolus stellatus SS14]
MAHFDTPEDPSNPISYFSDDTGYEATTIEVARAVRRSHPVHPLFAAATHANKLRSSNQYSGDDHYAATEVVHDTVHRSCPVNPVGRVFNTFVEYRCPTFSCCPASSNISVAGDSERDSDICESDDNSSISVGDSSDTSSSTTDETDELALEDDIDFPSYIETKCLPLENVSRVHNRNPFCLMKMMLLDQKYSRNNVEKTGRSYLLIIWDNFALLLISAQMFLV